MTMQQHDHLRLVRQQEPPTSRCVDDITRIHEPCTYEENMAFVQEMLTDFARASGDHGWVRRLVDVAIERDGEGSALPLTLLVSLNADVIERNTAALLTPGLRLVEGGHSTPAPAC